MLCFCIAWVAASAQTNERPAVVDLPIIMRHGDLLVETRVNGSKPLTFKLDTGFGITTINPDLVSSLGLERAGHMTILGIAGEEQADAYRGASFDFGGKAYEPRRLASLPSEGR